MDSSQFSDSQPRFDAIEQMDTQGATCDTFRVKLYGKLHFLKRLKPEYAGDIRYQEALRKEFETGYRLEHPNLVRYLLLDNDSILMEYVDGETLSQRLADNPDYFKKPQNTDKFVRQLLAVLSYLHSHQVLHLDLKPDNIMLTRINDDVKLIDLGFCYTDTFADTQGHTSSFAAPEQLSIIHIPEQSSPTRSLCPLSIQTDIYAFGKVLEFLPDHTIYNKVIARCTAEQPADRYQSVEEILHDINHKHRYFLWVAVIVLVVALISAGLSLFTHQKSEPTTIIEEVSTDTLTILPKDTTHQLEQSPAIQPKQQTSEKDIQTQLKDDLNRQIDQVYRSTIATFCDSVFPSPTPSTGKAWADASTEFHNQANQIADHLIKKYPNIPETTIRQETESRFQSLVSSVFNQMRNNAQ